LEKESIFLLLIVLATNRYVMSRHETSFKVNAPYKDVSYLDMTTAEGVYFVKLFDGVGYRLSKLMVVQN
jgi:hypothetical protein